MHLIIIIALGVFGGLWLFTQWAEWRERRRYRDAVKRADRLLNPNLHRTEQAKANSVDFGSPQVMALFFVAIALLLIVAAAASHPAPTGPWTR